MSLAAFTPQGPCCAITANIAGSLPSPIQMPTSAGGGASSVLIWNSGSVAAFLSYGQTSALATSNAVVPTGTGANSTLVIPLPGGTVQTLTLPANSYVCAITASSTAVLYIVPGEGV